MYATIHMQLLGWTTLGRNLNNNMYLLQRKGGLLLTDILSFQTEFISGNMLGSTARYRFVSTQHLRTLWLFFSTCIHVLLASERFCILLHKQRTCVCPWHRTVCVYVCPMEQNRLLMLSLGERLLLPLGTQHWLRHMTSVSEHACDTTGTKPIWIDMEGEKKKKKKGKKWLIFSVKKRKSMFS